MDVFKAIRTRIEVRQYSERAVPSEVKRQILEAARLSPSGMNTQHWRFILIDSKDDIKKLADLSTTGKWVSGADFGIIVLTDPKYRFHQIDAGRAITHMQLAAWENGVGSCIYVGINDEGMRLAFGIPESLEITAVVGFGYPAKPVRGRKRRIEIEKIAFQKRYGQVLDI